VPFKLLPRDIINRLQIYRELGPRGGLIYVKLRVLRALRLRRDRLHELPAEVHSILFVCHGNIIRSPMAAVMLRRYLSKADRPSIAVGSAGLHANPARGADARALTVAKEFGISLDDHRCRRLTPTLVEQTDVIFAMDYRNEAKLLAQYPEARGKVFLLGALAAGEQPTPLEIPDPYSGDLDTIRCCYATLHSRIRGLARILSPPDRDKRKVAPNGTRVPLSSQQLPHADALPPSEMKKILILSYHFPPDAAVGAIRAAKFAKYLPEFGWEPYVLTVKPRYYNGLDQERMADTPVSMNVFTTGIWPDPGVIYMWLKRWLYRLLGKRRVFEAKVRTYSPPDQPNAESIAGALRRLVRSLLVVADGELGWVPPATLKALLLMRRLKITCLYTSGPPHAAHVAGLTIKLLQSTRWIADFRDPWTLGIERPAFMSSTLADGIEAWLEGHVVKHADKVISVTDRMTQAFIARYTSVDKAKFVTLPNGYDPEDLQTVQVLTNNCKFRVSYLGTFYFGRTPADFLKAVRALINEGILAPNDLDIRFIGHCRHINGQSVEEMINEQGLLSVVQILDPLPYLDALREMVASDVLLLFAPNQPHQVPGKTFEYLASGADIIAFTSEGATADLLKDEAQGFIVEPNSLEHIKRALEQCYRRYKMKRHCRLSSLSSQHTLSRYQRKTLTKELALILE